MNAPVAGAAGRQFQQIPGGKLLRPLPRKRVERFVWQWPDTIWLLLAIAAAFLFSPDYQIRQAHVWIGLAIAAGAIASSYVAALKLHSRSAAVATAFLLASSRSFVGLGIAHPFFAGTACVTMAAIAGYSAGWLIVTYCAACLSVVFGFDGALVGLVIAVIPLLQRRERASAGLLVYAACAALWIFGVSHLQISVSMRPWHTWRDAESLIGLGLLVAWFAPPFYAAATLAGDRKRWVMPLALAGIIAAICFTTSSEIVDQLAVAIPLAMLVVGIGLGRIIPAIAGDYGSPAKRYVAATAAVALTLAVKIYLDPPSQISVAIGGSAPVTVNRLPAARVH